jgi:RND family efflux transporter MFP subunit
MPSSSQPRATAASEDYEVVAVLKGGTLFIFMDRYTDNSPVTKADLTVTVDSTELRPELNADGVFELQSKIFEQPGKHDLIFAINEGSKSDLLITSLEVPSNVEVSAAIAPSPSSALTRLKAALPDVTPWQIGAGVTVIVALSLLLLLRRRKQGSTLEPSTTVSDKPKSETGPTGVTRIHSRTGGPPAAAAILLLLAAPPTKAIAHGDEDHGDAKRPIAVSGDAPRRLPDASVFLPKPSQRLLDVRTVQAQQSKTQPSASLAGRVIANPDKFGVVQSTLGGRITPPAGGLPKLGQTVKSGEVLGFVAPYIAAIDKSDAAQTAGNLDQEIALAEARLARAKRLLAVNAGTAVEVEEREIEVDGLKKRRSAINVITTKLEPLIAPIDGVIAATKVVAGQVVEVKDVLYEIIDPSSLWVEAFAFDHSGSQAFSGASAAAQDGASFNLTFIGRSRALRQQSTVLQFEIVKPSASLNVGMPVTVLVHEGDPVQGIVLPKSAIVRSSNGEDVVWQHEAPERFVAKTVKVSSFDGQRVLVERGLKAGERIVVQGAELISQVR